MYHAHTRTRTHAHAHTHAHMHTQSEEEAFLGLQSTMFMDRNTPEKLPAIQLSFIQNLVSPLFHASAEAGIIPGIIETTRPPSTSSAPSTPVSKVPHENASTKQEGMYNKHEYLREMNNAF